MKSARAAYLFVVITLLIGGLFLAFLRSGDRYQQPAQTAGGRFELLDVTLRGEPFRSGSPLQQLFKDAIPNHGLSFGEFQLRKPEEFTEWQDAPLTVWLRYRGTEIRQRITPPIFGARVLAENSRGRQIENSLPSVRRSSSNEVIISVPLVAFPRDEDKIIVRFSPPQTNEASREWINFEIDNPFQREPARLVPQSLPRTNIVDGERIVLNDLSINPVVCDFELPGEGWLVPQCSIEDPEGNKLHASSARWKTSLPLKLQRGFALSLETNLPWRVEATFVRATNFAPADLRTLRLTAGGAEIALTNRSGEVSKCRLSEDALRIEGTAGDPPPQWIVTTATNLDTGRALKFFMDAQWTGVTGGAWSKYWALEGVATNVTVQLADPKTLYSEWCVDPSGARRTGTWVINAQNPSRHPLPQPLGKSTAPK
jgi:hypothetical protein